MSVNATGCGQPVAIPNRASSAKEPATPNARAADTTLTPSGEDRYVHERRSHGAPLGEGRRAPGEAKSDLDINTETDYCETYGRDLLTGAVQDWSCESEESR